MHWSTAVPLAVDIVDKEISARVGEGVELVCVGEGRGVAVEWWRGSTSLGKGLVTSEKEGHLLSKYQIDSVTQRDAGEYACRVTSPYFPNPLEDKATVTVLGKGYYLVREADRLVVGVCGGGHTYSVWWVSVKNGN